MAGRKRRNGRGGRRLGLLIAGAASTLTLLAPGAASAEVLHDQIDLTSPESTTSQDFEAEFNEYDSLTADDFTVPAGQVWQLESGLIRGKAFGTSTTSTVNVRFYRDAGGLPGTPIFSAQLQAPGYPRFQLPLAAVPDLAAGHYWLSVQAVLNAVSFGDPQQWFWAEHSEGFGSLAAFTNPGQGFPNSCGAFGPRSTCLPGHPAPDQSFSLSGVRKDVAPPETTIDKAPTKLKLKGTKKKVRATFEFSSSEAGSTFECSVDEGCLQGLHLARSR